MNIHEYISSGILEAYALGELTERERLIVEDNLVQFPELREELDRIEETQERFLMTLAVTPRNEVKEALFNNLPTTPNEGKVVSLQIPQQSINWWKWAAAASISIAVVATYLALDYYAKYQQSYSNLTELLAQNERVAQDYNQVNKRLDKIEGDLKVIDNPAFTRVVMRGTDNAPGALAHIYWNESTEEVYISIQQMKALAQENQYQLWAIIDGKPVDAGVFDASIAGLVKMKTIGKNASLFAVTIEPRGGNPSPTLETMQVAGAVAKG